MSLLGLGIRNKLRLFICVSIGLVPVTLLRLLPPLERRLRIVADSAARGCIIVFNNLQWCLVDSESLLAIAPSYEGWVWKYLTPKAGDVFLDVGAHIGRYSLTMAKLVGEKGALSGG